MNYLKYIRHPRAQRTLLALSLKKVLRRFFFKCNANRVLFQCIRCCPYSLQQLRHMYWRLISLEEITQFWKSVMWDCKLEHIKIITNRNQYAKATEDEEVYILNKCSYSIWKQSNKSDLLASYHDFQLIHLSLIMC